MIAEGLNIEYKREYVEDIKKTVIAFANTDGGKVYIGIGDDGQIIGVNEADDTMLKLTNAIRDTIKPDVTLFISYETQQVESKTIVVLNVQKGTACPYYLAGKGIRPEGVYIRQGASTAPATESTILRMIKDTAGDDYESVRSLNQELTFESLKAEFDQAEIKLEEAQMKTLRLIGNDGLYSNLGLLLSDQCMHTIKLAIFEGTTKEIFKDRYEFDGSLLKQLRACHALIDRYNRTRSEFDQLTRKDLREYPPSAIREALLNSIVHREYSYSASTLISVFDDKIEFVTIGGLVKGISQADMRLGVSILRNKNLANVFYRLKLIEAYGTGIPKIIESYHDFPILPKIETTDNAFKITLYSTHNLYGAPVVAGMIKETLSYGEQRVADLMPSSETFTRKDIERALSVSQPMAIKYLKNLLDKGAVEKIGTGKNVRYRLRTAAGNENQYQ